MSSSSSSSSSQAGPAACDVDMTAYRPQQRQFEVPARAREDVRNYFPFKKTEVPDNKEEDAKEGPGIRINDKAKDDHNTVEVELKRCDPVAGTTVFLLKRSSGDIKVWYERARKNEVKFDAAGVSDPLITMPQATRTVLSGSAQHTGRRT